MQARLTSNARWVAVVVVVVSTEYLLVLHSIFGF